MKKRMVRRVGILSAALFGILQVSTPLLKAAGVVTVAHRLSSDGVRPGEFFKVALLVNIAPGYHINGNELADAYLLPTELILEAHQGIEVEESVFPKPHSARFSYTESEVAIYEGDIVIGLLIRTEGTLGPGVHRLTGKLIYQACDSQTCLTPQELKLDVPFEAVPPSRKTQEINQDVFADLQFKKVKS
jgi:DsbC/DsbD-like thiol-disulfide interchange protein